MQTAFSLYPGRRWRSRMRGTPDDTDAIEDPSPYPLPGYRARAVVICHPSDKRAERSANGLLPVPGEKVAKPDEGHSNNPNRGPLGPPLRRTLSPSTRGEGRRHPVHRSQFRGRAMQTAFSLYPGRRWRSRMRGPCPMRIEDPSPYPLPEYRARALFICHA